MGEYVSTDPRCDGGLQLELQRGMMASFRKQKRQRYAGSIVDSEEDDDEGAHLCTPPTSFILMLRPSFSRTLSRALILIVASLVFLVSSFVGGWKISKHPAKKVDNMNMRAVSAEKLYPHRALLLLLILLLLLFLLLVILLLILQVRYREARRGYVEDQGRSPQGIRGGAGHDRFLVRAAPHHRVPLPGSQVSAPR